MTKKPRQRRTRRNLGVPLGCPETSTWIPLIRYAESKLDRARLKVLQLEALIEDFRKKARAGEPSPIDIAAELLPATDVPQFEWPTQKPRTAP